MGSGAGTREKIGAVRYAVRRAKAERAENQRSENQSSEVNDGDGAYHAKTEARITEKWIAVEAAGRAGAESTEVRRRPRAAPV